MKLNPWDPDITTLLGRIKSGDLNLQPDFQRGEVWPISKKQRLIDTVLRDWHVPPVHIVIDPITEHQEVLDGQQRLVAIRDFEEGIFPVDGTCKPFSSELSHVDGLFYNELPEKLRRRFDNYSIRVIRITDYEPEEPGELFYRLNQPTNLTPAEQRNAFYGAARAQVKELISIFDKSELDYEAIGFKNSRMAYDDVVARACFILEDGSLRTKITAASVTDKYRSGQPFPEEVVRRTRKALLALAKSSPYFRGEIKFNKASLFSWIVFIATAKKYRSQFSSSAEDLGGFIADFESSRQGMGSSPTVLSDRFERMEEYILWPLLDSFNDRATARVSDVSSVCARDFSLWAAAALYFDSNEEVIELLPPTYAGLLRRYLGLVRRGGKFDEHFAEIERIASNSEWGDQI